MKMNLSAVVFVMLASNAVYAGSVCKIEQEVYRDAPLAGARLVGVTLYNERSADVTLSSLEAYVGSSMKDKALRVELRSQSGRYEGSFICTRQSRTGWVALSILSKHQRDLSRDRVLTTSELGVLVTVAESPTLTVLPARWSMSRTDHPWRLAIYFNSGHREAEIIPSSFKACCQPFGSQRTAFDYRCIVDLQSGPNELGIRSRQEIRPGIVDIDAAIRFRIEVP